MENAQHSHSNLATPQHDLGTIQEDAAEPSNVEALDHHVEDRGNFVAGLREPENALVDLRETSTIPVPLRMSTAVIHPLVWAQDVSKARDVDAVGDISSDWVSIGSSMSSWTDLRLTPSSDSQLEMSDLANAQSEAQEDQPPRVEPEAPENLQDGVLEFTFQSSELAATPSLELGAANLVLPSNSRHQTRAGVKKNTKKKGKLSQQGREEAKIQRQVGNCLRCRTYNLKVGTSCCPASETGLLTGPLQCDPGTPCEKCRRVMDNPRQFFGPCYRDKITEVTLARHGEFLRKAICDSDLVYIRHGWQMWLTSARKRQLWPARCRFQ